MMTLKALKILVEAIEKSPNHGLVFDARAQRDWERSVLLPALTIARAVVATKEKANAEN